MAKFYGDIPCVKINGKIHITVGGTKCLCGRKYVYGMACSRETMSSRNIIWRTFNAVTCNECQRKYMKGREDY